MSRKEVLKPAPRIAGAGMTGKAYLEVDEVERLERAATNARDRLLICLLFRTGCRVSEVVALGVEDLDLQAEMVRVVRLKQRLQVYCPGCGTRLGRSHSFCSGCGERVGEVVRREMEMRRQRILPLDWATVEMLREFVSHGGPVKKNDKHLLFGIGRGQAWRVVNQAAQSARLPPLVNPETGRRHGVSPHRLRDAFAVHAVKLDDSGDGLRLLQEHLGHASFNTTARYRKVSGQEHRRWYERLWSENDTGEQLLD